MSDIYDAVRYMSEKIHYAETQTNIRVFELEKQVKLLLELNNGSVNLEDMIRREVLKVLRNS